MGKREARLFWAWLWVLDDVFFWYWTEICQIVEKLVLQMCLVLWWICIFSGLQLSCPSSPKHLSTRSQEKWCLRKFTEGSGEPYWRLVYVHDFRCKHVVVVATSREKLIKITIHDIGFCCGALSQNVSFEILSQSGSFGMQSKFHSN